MAVDSANPDQYTERASRLLANNYGPAPLTFVGADGSRLIDADGTRYLDFGSGISVTSFGHGHTAVRQAVERQLEGVWHTSNLFYTQPVIDLADALIDSCFAHRVFFANSGAEANEAAIKLVRKAVSSDRAPSRRTIITFQGGFHGRTLTTVTATAQPKYHAGFEPLPDGFRYCDFNNVAALRDAVDDSVCAVLFEPIQGEGGIHVASPEFVAEIQRLSDRGLLVMVDEVQTGIARTGKLWAHEWYPSLVPDVMTSAKALGGGLPIGALLIGERLSDVFQPGSHGSTFGGNPVCCAAANAVLTLARDPALHTRIEALGEALVEGLMLLNERYALFDEVRGRGLMVGAPLRKAYRHRIGDLLAACRDQRLLVLQAGDGVLRFLPPLVITHADIAAMLVRLDAALQDVFFAKESA